MKHVWIPICVLTVCAQAQTSTPVGTMLQGPQGFPFGRQLTLEGSDLFVSPVQTNYYRLIPGVGPTYLETLPASGFDSALFGDIAVSTDPGDGDNAIVPSAIVFEHDGNSWTPVANLGMGAGVLDIYEYGRSAAVGPDRVMIGAPLAEPSFPPAGKVYVYERISGAWAPSPSQPAITPHNGVPDGRFGHAMATTGDWLLVGQYFNPTSGANLYEWSGTQWDFVTEFGPTGTGTNVGAAGFGVAMEMDGDYAVITNEFVDVGGVPTAGAAYVFEYDGTQWTGPAVLEPFDAQALARFGSSVDVDAASGQIVIGSRRWDRPGQPNVGAAYTYHRFGPLDWQLSERLEPDLVNAASLQFGTDVQCNADFVVIGTEGSGVYVHEPIQNLGFAPSSPTMCNGDGGDQAGCIDCPCGNNAPPGTVGGCLNAQGQSARLRAERSLSVFEDDLRMSVEDAGPSTFALLGSGAIVPSSGVCPPGTGLSPASGTDGLRCIGGGILRHGVRQTDSDGDSITPWTNLASASGFIAGQTRQFQVVYRESPTGPCGNGQSTTNGLSISFLP